MKRNLLFAVALFAIAGSVLAASWYDEYNDGIKAVSGGRWATVIQKMTAAIASNPKENDNARTYGNIFINYHPYYYRGVAYLRTGKYDQAISDFEKTSGPGENDQGSLVNLMQEAKMKQAQASTPEPVTPPPPVPQPPQPIRPTPQPPVTPTIDPALRQQVNTAINTANQSLAVARDRKAGSSPQYQQAMNALADANQKVATAKTDEDLRAALASANNAKLFADSAMPPNVPPVPVPTTTTKPIVATGEVLGDTARRVRTALENYFSGEFETASDQFSRLSQEMPKNGWIWAFLGASQYSRYAFEADETYKSQAMQSFKKAKQYRSWGKNGLPQKYFSKRIRRVFESAS